MAYFNTSITSVTRKVIAGFLLVFVAIVMALAISHFGFSEMMATVDKLSEPNPKLAALNTIFQQITALEQSQRAQAIRNPRNPYSVYLEQSASFVSQIDSLELLDWDSAQLERLQEVKIILQKRNRLFLSYLKLRSQMAQNYPLSARLDTLTRMLASDRLVFDTSVVTTEKKTITTYTTDSIKQEKERSGLARIFGKKKNNEAPTTHVKVEEQLSVTIDTLSIGRQNQALSEVEGIIGKMEKEQRAESRRLITEELELLNANSLFINQLLSILHDVENEEVAQMHANNDRAGDLVSQSIWRISIVLIVFFIGAALLVYLIWVDVARSNYYKQQLEKSRDEAEELSQIKQRFLANMSHEIRTPLQSIIGFAEQLRSGDGSESEAVDAINSSSEHLLHIVDEVLDYSRISSGGFVLNKERFALAPLLKEVIAALTIQADRKGLNLLLETNFERNLVVIGDAFRLRQILYNLLGNAIKFTGRGYVKLTARTHIGKGPVVCDFEITDTGIGIRKEELSKIFNQFEQANSSITGQYGGTGLGLTIVKSLIEAQGGNLRVQSVPNQGSTFTVTLAFEHALPEDTRVTGVTRIDNKRFSGKVVVVDDDLLILRLCHLILEKNDVENETFNDGRELLALKVDPKVTHIFMDIRMPSINGIDLCRALRKKYAPTTKFIALTAHVLPQERQQLLFQGFDDVMLKPFREQNLLARLGVTPQPLDIKTNHAGREAQMDLSTLTALTQDDDALLNSILQQFIEETTRDLHQLIELLKSPSDHSGVREVVHKLAGRTGQVGASGLSRTLRSLESQLVDGGASPGSLREEFDDALVKVAQLIEEVRTTTVLST